MAPRWAKALILAAFGVSSADDAVTCEQDSDHEVLLLQVDTQFKKIKANGRPAAQIRVEIDETALMQTETQVTEGVAVSDAKDKAPALFKIGSSLLAPKSKEVGAYFQRFQQSKASQPTAAPVSTGSVSKSKAAALFATGSSLLAPKSKEVGAYFQRRQQLKASQKAAAPIQKPVAQPSAAGRESGIHGLASFGSLGSIFAPNAQVSEYLKAQSLEKASRKSAAAPVSALAKRGGAKVGGFSGSVLSPKSQEVSAYMKRRHQQTMVQSMKEKYRTVMMVVPASAEPQALLQEWAAPSAESVLAAAADSVDAAGDVEVATAW